MFQTHISPEYLTSDVISNGVVHCFSTRHGGVSTGCLASLNLGTHRGDDWNNVYENYRRLGAAVGFTPEQTVFTRQTHTDIVARVGAAERGDGLFREVEPERDGICTNEPGVALDCFAADCTPILLHDPVRRAVAAVHAGWRGVQNGIVVKTLDIMREEWGCDPADIFAAVSRYGYQALALCRADDVACKVGGSRVFQRVDRGIADDEYFIVALALTAKIFSRSLSRSKAPARDFVDRCAVEFFGVRG